MGGLLLMLFLLHSCTNSAAAQKRKSNIISLGSYLTPTTDPSWFSPSGIFAFGFYQLQPNGNNYAVCISFAGFSERTVVWTANRDNPIVPDNVKLVLTGDGELNLQQRVSQYLSIINFDIAHYSESIGSAAMLDNGNFVLYSLYDNRVIWQSFDHPTDTLLPGQRLTPGSMLLSRASQTDFAKGIFTLKMQTDGDLVQYPVDARTDTYEYAYYASNTAGGGFNVSLNLDNDGRLYLLNGSSTVLKNITRGGGGGTIHLMRIDVDGIFRLYRQSWDRRGDNNWRSIWSSTEDKCLPKGSCGLNSFCTYLNQTVDCKCLPGFDFIEAGNWTAGCARNFSVGTCANKDQGSLYEMTRVPNVDWKDNGYDIDNVIREEDCGRACLDDCYCDAAFFKDGWCRRQRLPLRYGRWLPIYPTTALVKVARRASYNSGSKSRLSDLQKYVVTGVSLGIASLVISSIIVYYVKYRWHNRSNQHVDKFMLNHGSLSLKRYSYNKIKKMTKSLRDKLGKGGYGIVYKGNLPDTGQLVAVKVLTETSNNAEDFVNEVASISRTSHVNIVNLLGFCYERKKRALIYEFMPNGSLDKFIYKSTGSVDPERSLEQGKLYEIAVGIARGLEYLHRGCNTRIVHFDIKPQNILLDEDFCPKISDFGLAKLVKKKQSKISMLGVLGKLIPPRANEK